MVFKKIITWEDVYKSCKEVAHQCRDSNISALLAVSRGGLVPARILSELLNISKIYSIGLQSYNKNISENINEYQNPLEDILTDTSLREVVIVDEIADSGNTFKYIHDIIQKNLKTIALTSTNSHIVSFRFAALYVRESCCFKPSLYHKTIKNSDWLVFPWEEKDINIIK